MGDIDPSKSALALPPQSTGAHQNPLAKVRLQHPRTDKEGSGGDTAQELISRFLKLDQAVRDILNEIGVVKVTLPSGRDRLTTAMDWEKILWQGWLGLQEPVPPSLRGSTAGSRKASLDAFASGGSPVLLGSPVRKSSARSPIPFRLPPLSIVEETVEEEEDEHGNGPLGGGGGGSSSASESRGRPVMTTKRQTVLRPVWGILYPHCLRLFPKPPPSLQLTRSPTTVHLPQDTVAGDSTEAESNRRDVGDKIGQMMSASGTHPGMVLPTAADVRNALSVDPVSVIQLYFGPELEILASDRRESFLFSFMVPFLG